MLLITEQLAKCVQARAACSCVVVCAATSRLQYVPCVRVCMQCMFARWLVCPARLWTAVPNTRGEASPSASRLCVCVCVCVRARARALSVAHGLLAPSGAPPRAAGMAWHEANRCVCVACVCPLPWSRTEGESMVAAGVLKCPCVWLIGQRAAATAALPGVERIARATLMTCAWCICERVCASCVADRLLLLLRVWASVANTACVCVCPCVCVVVARGCAPASSAAERRVCVLVCACACASTTPETAPAEKQQPDSAFVVCVHARRAHPPRTHVHQTCPAAAANELTSGGVCASVTARRGCFMLVPARQARPVCGCLCCNQI
jgi:hypothetical protein